MRASPAVAHRCGAGCSTYGIGRVERHRRCRRRARLCHWRCLDHGFRLAGHLCGLRAPRCVASGWSLPPRAQPCRAGPVSAARCSRRDSAGCRRHGPHRRRVPSRPVRSRVRRSGQSDDRGIAHRGIRRAATQGPESADPSRGGPFRKPTLWLAGVVRQHCHDKFCSNTLASVR
jgi:hypothetical protein